MLNLVDLIPYPVFAGYALSFYVPSELNLSENRIFFFLIFKFEHGINDLL